MLAVLTEERFSDPDWIFERKLDGERSLAFRRGTRLWLLSRTEQRLNDTYPEIVEALLAQDCTDFVVDGEIVAFEGAQTSFARLQRRMQLRDPERARRSGVAVFYYAFDLLRLDGRDTTGLPLRERKTLLRSSLTFDDPVRYLPHRNAEGAARCATPARSAPAIPTPSCATSAIGLPASSRKSLRSRVTICPGAQSTGCGRSSWRRSGSRR
jgi:bifunctional non-homologous end joining protein LigD